MHFVGVWHNNGPYELGLTEQISMSAAEFEILDDFQPVPYYEKVKQGVRLTLVGEQLG